MCFFRLTVTIVASCPKLRSNINRLCGQSPPGFAQLAASQQRPRFLGVKLNRIFLMSKKLGVVLLCVVLVLVFLVYSEDFTTSLASPLAPLRRTLLNNEPVYSKDSAAGQPPALPQLTRWDALVSSHSIWYNPQSNWTSKWSDKVRPSNQTLPLLNVHIVMHSHVDPGWLRTFEEYYVEKVKSILDLTIKQLTEKPDLRFIWSEMSFLERWWQDATPEQRLQTTILVQSGRLELTGGAWVMTDEATPYFWASIDNMIEGHAFVKNTFNVTPQTSWSVDPFGHGLMYPYLVAEAKITGMVIGRLSKHLKEELRDKGMLMFNWAQPSDENQRLATPLVSALPRTFYTTADSCGPDSNICCQFDLGSSARSSCGSRAKSVNDANVEVYANMLMGQYRQLERFYESNSLLVPVGDDFFFSQEDDWTVTHASYGAIFKHINAHPEKYHANIKFSTVANYFEDAREQQDTYPLLTGDFFPYTEDKNGFHPYWTGFYVHLPAFKRIERLTQSKLRSYDLLAAVASFHDARAQVEPARRNLALCQHHDSITATSKPHVMKDYQTRLQTAFAVVDNAISEVVAKKIFPQGETFSLIELPHDAPDGKSNKHTVTFTREISTHDLMVFNQGMLQERQKITLRVNDPRVEVSSAGEIVASQVMPLPNFETGRISNSTYELVFFIELKPLEIKKVTLQWKAEQPASTIISMVFSNKATSNIFPVFPLNGTNSFLLSNRYFAVHFSDGQIDSVKKAGDNDSIGLKVRYGAYGDRGGAYVFASTGRLQRAKVNDASAKTVSFLPLYVVGPIISKAFSTVSESLIQTVIIDNGNALSDFAIHLEIYSHLDKTDITTVMDVQTDIMNSNRFYTDVNGMFYMKRLYNDNVNLEGNFYPMASSSFIEDGNYRLTIVSGQSTGVTTTANGTMEVLLDRRLSASDGKGLDMGDAARSPPSVIHFDLLLESKVPAARNIKKVNNAAFFSNTAYFALQNLIYGPELRILRNKTNDFYRREIDWPCNIELINIRYLDDGTGIILLRRLPFDDALPQVECARNNYELIMESLLTITNSPRLIKTSITGLHDEDNVSVQQLESLLSEPLKIIAFKFLVF
uniref:Alpha-mannosidase n=1 Tax=Panagrellus redivivus TaxID=6233 RepID=A0A7E4W906_PANRE